MIGSKLKLLCFIAGLCLIAIPNSMSNPLTNKIHLKELDSFIVSLQGGIDGSVKACDNFQKYACGKLDHDHYYNMYNIEKILKHYFVDNEPTTDAERMVRDFYLSCKKGEEKRATMDDLKELFNQVDVLKSIGSYPVKGEFTSKDYSRIAAELMTIGDMQVFYIAPSNKSVLFGARGDQQTYDASEIAKSMIKMGATNEEAELAAADVYEFVNKLNKIEYNHDEDGVKINSIDEFKKSVDPNMVMDWDEFFGVVDKYLTFDKEIAYPVIKNLDLTKKVVDLFGNTDKKTVMNFYIFKFISFFHGFEDRPASCGDFEVFFRPAVLRKLWDDNLKSEDVVKYNQFLNDFEKSLSNFFDSTDYTSYLNDRLNKYRDVVNHNEEFLSKEYVTHFYQQIHFETDAFYKNAITFMRKMYNDISDAILQTDFKTNKQIMTFFGVYDHLINANGHGKPYIYYYSAASYDMWHHFFRKNEPYSNYSNVEECLKQIDEHKDKYNNELLMEHYASLKTSLMPFERDTKNIASELYAEFEAFEGDVRKLYYLSVAQHQCHSGQTDGDDAFFRAIKYSDEFAEAFECAEGTPMNKNNNKYCRIQGCHNESLRNVMLAPYNLAVCQRLLKKLLDIEVDLKVKVG